MSITPLSTQRVSAYSVDTTNTLNSFKSAFYTLSNGNGMYKADNNGGQSDFWKEAEMIVWLSIKVSKLVCYIY